MPLYFFLTTSADHLSLSFYSDGATAALLSMTVQAIVEARDELLACDLVAYERPLTQVLSLPTRAVRRQARSGTFATGRRVPTDRSAFICVRRSAEAAMKVALWAEIRPLHEMEQLSARAIAQRVHFATVA